MTAATTQRVLTPTTSRVLRRSAFWAGGLVFAAIVAVLGMLLAGSFAGGVPLSATNPAPAGAKALVEVLRQQGVTVTATGSLEATSRAITDPEQTTLFFFDPDGILDSAQRAEAFGLASRVVAVNPSFDELAALAPDVAQAGTVAGTVEAECALPAARKAGSVTGDGTGFRYTGPGSGPVVSCFGSGDGVYSLVQVPTEFGTATVLGTQDALTNEFITDVGNAALALNLLGATGDLVWYIPTVTDLTTAAPPTLGELSPDWVIPLTSLLLLTLLAAAFWRGRRFGPLIVENLPVTVRANETMQGRARLYEKSSARLRALDALRIGSVERLAARCGLPRAATVDEVAAAVAAVTGRDLPGVRRIIIDAVPSSDRELVRVSDELLALERAVATSVTPT